MSRLPRWFALMTMVALVVGSANSQHATTTPTHSPTNHSPTNHLAANQPPTPKLQVGSAGEMIGFAGESPAGQIITLIHTGKSWMSVYHIAPDGEIRLTSSRPIDADFSLELNVTAPKPADIRRVARQSSGAASPHR